MDFDDCLHDNTILNDDGTVEYCEDCNGSRVIEPYSEMSESEE